MLATSMSVVVAPSFFNFATALLHDAQNLGHFAARNPVFCATSRRGSSHTLISIGRIDVNVQAVLLEREEVEAIPALAEHGRAHSDSIVALRLKSFGASVVSSAAEADDVAVGILDVEVLRAPGGGREGLQDRHTVRD